MSRSSRKNSPVRKLVILATAAGLVAAGTAGASAFILDEPQIPHFFTCLGYMLRNQQDAHHAECWPYKGITEYTTLSSGGGGPPATPVTTTVTTTVYTPPIIVPTTTTIATTIIGCDGPCA